jgi:hypothetical protein
MTQVAISSIQLMIAPAVLMTTAAILAGGVQTMYSAVIDRMRDMAHERLIRLTATDGGLQDRRLLGAGSAFRVDEIDAQLPLLRARHRHLRTALHLFYGSVLLVVVAMILIAVAITVPAPAAGTIALVAILLATVALLFGLGAIALSIRPICQRD